MTGTVRADDRGADVVAGPAPVDRLADTFGLLDDLDRLRRSSMVLLQEVERATNLHAGDVLALRAVGEDAADPGDVARHSGQSAAAGSATVDGLLARELVTRTGAGRHGGTPGRALRLTSRGRALLDQAEAVEIRLTSGLLSELGPVGEARLREAIHALVVVLERAPRGAPPAGSRP